MSFAYAFKVILVGEAGVGKSCVLLQFTDHRFNPNCEATIGVEFGVRVFTRPIPGPRKPIKLQVWDTAGQCTYRSIVRSYYRGAAGVLLVYDVTRRETFNALEQWLNEVRENSGVGANKEADPVILLAGNKCDLEKVGRREVTHVEGQKFAEKHGLLFAETSAKNAESVETAFGALTDGIFARIQAGTIHPDESGTNGIRLGPMYEKEQLYAPPPPLTTTSSCC